MYKNLDKGKQLLLAELLQQIQPRDNTDGPEAEAMAARKLQADYMDRMIKDTAPKVKPKGPDLAGTAVDINALVSIFLKDVEKSKANKNSGRFDSYSEPVANADGQFSRKEDFVSLLKPVATKVAADLGIDPKIIMAQAILETGYGSAVKGKNYFGIKSHGRSGGIDVFTHESLGGKPVKMTDKFRSYDSLEDSVKDYGTFLKENKRYTPLLEADTLEDQLEATGASGYATDPRYKKRLKGIIEGKTFNELLG
jgi:flagellum-specific peptidoglycan hydrolase FlgJ